ncbi:MAG: hypothetical protein WBA44_12235 [Mesorhizobium sp.]
MSSLAITRSSEDIQRAWEYHRSADELLHARTDALLIAHAFLVVAYLQILDYSAEKSVAPQIAVLLQVLIIFVASASSTVIVVANRHLSNAMRFLKSEYLSHDEIYRDYMAIALSPRRLISFWLPACLFVFWIGAIGVLVLGWISPELFGRAAVEGRV